MSLPLTSLRHYRFYLFPDLVDYAEEHFRAVSGISAIMQE